MDIGLQGFDFGAAMRLLCDDIVARLPELSHIDFDRVAVSVCQTRHNESHGVYAALTPLRFEHGALRKVMGGRQYGVERVCSVSGTEYLYILSFYLPRFLNTSLEEKLATIIHELWHINPKFDGDLRRHEGRYYAHGPSQRDYDAQMERLAQRWLSLDPPEHLYEFLMASFEGLIAEFDKIVGVRWPAPKLILL